MEALVSAGASFVTLTYDEENVPYDTAIGRNTLFPDHLQLWLKRMRERLDRVRVGGRFRFYGVGEYGDASWRPHYHVVVFGPLPGETRLLTEATWGLGRTQTLNLSNDLAAYITGYIAKKMTRYDDPRLHGCAPEFCRMSLRPGIGADAVPALGSSLSDAGILARASDIGDVPNMLRHGRKAQPLGRYLKGKLREYLGHENPHKMGKEAQLALSQRLHDMRRSLTSVEADPYFIEANRLQKEIDNARMVRAEYRAQMYKQRRRI